MQNISQSQEFLYFYLIGIIVSFVFDIFRSTRKNFKTSDFMTYLEDILFLTIATVIIMFGILKISGGVLRFYIFLGLFIGITIYSLTLSKFCIIIINSIVIFLKNIVVFIVKNIKKVIFFFKNIGKILHI